MRLNNRITALKECYYNTKLENIDVEEMKEKIETAEKYEKQRLEVRLEQKLANRIQLEKMIIDCKQEIADLYSAFQQLPKMTREEFEKEEEYHFELKFAKELKLSKEFGSNKATASSIDNMSDDSLKRIQSKIGEPESLRLAIKESRLNYE